MGMLSLSPPVAGENHPPKRGLMTSPHLESHPLLVVRKYTVFFLFVCCIHFANYFARYN
jgi:hypothetical protein